VREANNLLKPGLSNLPGGKAALQRKLNGETSMFEKAGRGESVKPPARRGPDGMAKAGLPEPKRPNRKAAGREGRLKPDAARRTHSVTRDAQPGHDLAVPHSRADGLPIAI